MTPRGCRVSIFLGTEGVDKEKHQVDYSENNLSLTTTNLRLAVAEYGYFIEIPRKPC